LLNQIESWFSIPSGPSLNGRQIEVSSPATTRTPNRSPGQKDKSTKSASSRVSPIDDSERQKEQRVERSGELCSPPWFLLNSS